jgi:hypothetical protein
MSSVIESFQNELEAKGIEVIEHKCRHDNMMHKCRTCVLGVLLSENGKEIEAYMLSWLTEKYNVFSVRQPAPGILFEYPALRFAQLYSIQHEESVLYLHTKGAAHKGRFQRKTVNMWRNEFVNKKSEYEQRIGHFELLMPYSGPQDITWLNGFIASPNAFSSIPPITELGNRYIFEILFKGSGLSCFGRRLLDIQRTDETDNTAEMYKDINRFSPSFSSVLYHIHSWFLRFK